MNKQSQCQQILSFIRRHGSITSWQAFQHLAITRLSGRIYDLKEQGYPVKGEPIRRNGKHFHRYSLTN